MIRYYLKNIEWGENITENDTEMEIVCDDNADLDDVMDDKGLDILSYEIAKKEVC